MVFLWGVEAEVPELVHEHYQSVVQARSADFPVPAQPEQPVDVLEVVAVMDQVD